MGPSAEITYFILVRNNKCLQAMKGCKDSVIDEVKSHVNYSVHIKDTTILESYILKSAKIKVAEKETRYLTLYLSDIKGS